MPNKQRSKKSKGRRRNGAMAQGGKVETVTGRMYFGAWQSVGASDVFATGAYYLNPFLTNSAWTGTRTYGDQKLVDMSRLFQYWRFTKIKFKLLPQSNLNLTILTNQPMTVVAGYCPSVPGGASILPTNQEQIYGLPWVSDSVVFQADGGTIPSVPRWHNVPRSLLLGQPIKWWRTFPTPPTVPTGDILSNYIQGNLCIGFLFPTFVTSTINVAFSMDLEYTIQFKDFYDGPSAALVTPEETAVSNILAQLRRRPVRQAVALISDEDEKSDDEMDDSTLHQVAGHPIVYPAAPPYRFAVSDERKELTPPPDSDFVSIESKSA